MQQTESSLFHIQPCVVRHQKENYSQRFLLHLKQTQSISFGWKNSELKERLPYLTYGPTLLGCSSFDVYLSSKPGHKNTRGKWLERREMEKKGKEGKREGNKGRDEGKGRGEPGKSWVRRETWGKREGKEGREEGEGRPERWRNVKDRRSSFIVVLCIYI